MTPWDKAVARFLHQDGVGERLRLLRERLRLLPSFETRAVEAPMSRSSPRGMPSPTGGR